MAKLKSTFINMFLSLSIICLTVAFSLAQVNKMTLKPIAEAKALKLQTAIGEVVPEFDNDPVAESYMIASEGGDSLLVYPATKDGEVVGFAISSSSSGFSGEIQIMIGFDMDDKIVNYEILQHAETPGLGSKMGEWFKDMESNSKSIIGRDMSLGTLAVTNDGGSVDAITASTITSRAFLNAVNKAYIAYSGSKLDSYSGATTDDDTENN
jgi:electron transport complex protein RnfG